MARYCGVLAMALNDVLRNLNRAVLNMNKKVEKQIELCAEDLLSKAVDRTPIDTGELRKSGTVSVDKKGMMTTGKVSFGGIVTGKQIGRAHV